MNSSSGQTGAVANVDIARLEKLVVRMQESLPGLLATDIWIAETGVSIAAINGQPVATKLFNTLTTDLSDALATSGFPVINRYYLLELEGDLASLVIRHGDDLRQGVLFDTRYTNIGTMLALGLPMAQRGVEEARTAD
ncbi:MAG: hypothetical protein WBL06_00110 [Pseudolysinimonas sp.]|uniref:hypothetical protein n=1 Tax=Pseudolysinimonas sp. TaxID=2680009 RepID=UPI003C746D12